MRNGRSRRASTSGALALILLALGACGEDDGGGGGGATPPVAVAPTPTPSPTPSPTPGVGTVGAAGGTITLPSVASVTFPSGAVADNTRVALAQVATPSSDPRLTETAAFLSAGNIAGQSVRVAVGTRQPTQPVTVKLTVASGYISGLPTGQKARVLALSETDSDLEESAPTYEILPATVDAATMELRFTAPPYFFSTKEGDQFVGRFVVVTSPGA